MKKVLILLSLILLGFSSCENDYEDGLSKSDILGKWVSGKNAIVFNKDGTYDSYGYYGKYESKLSGTYSFDPKSRVWVQYRNDGHSYTNIILLLDNTCFSYVDQYGNNNIWERP